MKHVVKLANALKRLVFAGRVDDLKAKFPDFAEGIDALAENDPSGTNKYLLWSTKQLVAGARLEDLIPTVNLFHQYQRKLEKKDINQYRTLKELEDAVKDLNAQLSKRQQRKQVKVEGADKLWEDDNITIIWPKQKQACIYYGAGTQWCITMEGSSHWEQYVASNVVFFFALRKQMKGDALDKVAITYHRDIKNKVKKVEFYNAQDTVVKAKAVIDGVGLSKALLADLKQKAAQVPKGALAKVKAGEATLQDIKAILATGEFHLIEAAIQNMPKKQLQGDILALFVDYITS